MAAFLKTISLKIWYFIQIVFQFIFGRFEWNPPFWLRKIAAGLKKIWNYMGRNIKASAFGIAALALLVIAGGYGWHWYQSLPVPVTVAYDVSAPSLTDYDRKPYVGRPVYIRFQTSVAPIEKIGKTVDEGISLNPKIDGRWVWSQDNVLRFFPMGDWPIDQVYTVNFDKKGFFKPGVLLNSYKGVFKTPVFNYKITKSTLYEDPVAPTQKKMVSTVRATHPIDQNDFADRVGITLSKGLIYLDPRAKNQPQVFFSDNGQEAYIHSAFVALPDVTSVIKTTIDKGVRSALGGNRINNSRSEDVSVPGRYQLSFESAKVQFVDNSKGEPEPVFIIESSMAVDDSEIADKVKAWELPVKNSQKPNERWTYQEVTEDLLTKSARISLTHIPSDAPQNRIHAFKFNAMPGRQLYVRVDAKIKAAGGYLSPMAKTIYFSTMPQYPKMLAFMSNGALLSLNGERHVAITARGMNGVQAEIARVLPGQLNHLVRRLDGKFKRPDMTDNQFSELVERMELNIPLYARAPNETTYSSIDLSPYLNTDGARQGIFVLRVSEAGRQDTMTLGDVSEVRDYRFVVVTDLGIIAKTADDGSHEIFVQSISKGGPVADAVVEVYGLNGLPVAHASTDVSGYVHFDNLGQLSREKQPLMYVVTKGNDQSFLPIASSARQLDLSRFEIGGISDNGDGNILRAYLFSERGLYRPGETVHLGIMVRSADWKGTIAGLPVKLDISDPQGRSVHSEQLILNETAFLSFDFKSNPNAPAGTYTARLSLPDNVRGNQSRFLGSVAFSIRDFEPDRMKVTARLTQEDIKGWAKPKDIEAKISAMHLFGAPAADRRVALEMTVESAFPGFSAYRDYRFYVANELKQGFFDDLTDKKTDEKGEAVFDLDLKRFDASVYNLAVMARVFEAGGGRNVAADANVLVSDQDFMLGVKSKDSLSYIKKDSERYLDLLAVDQQLGKVAVDGLTSELIEVRYISVLVQKKNKTYAYESRRKDIVVETAAFNLSENGLHQRLRTDEPGRYIFKIKKGGVLLNQQEYYVAGNANTSRALDRNAELQIKLDKSNYKAGDFIAVSINAPYTGSGLITIERDKVYSFVWFNAPTTSSIQYIRLPEGIEGNAYINVQFVRGPSSEEVYMSPLSYAVKPFSINLDERRLSVALDVPKTVEPGEKLPIKVSLEKPTQIVVWGVDEGILQVARYEQPMPLEFFFRKRALAIKTAQILDLILPEFSQLLNAAATGGDGDDNGTASHLNPFKRKAKPPVVYWSGILSLPAGVSQLEWDVPDYFNGKMHFFAVAVSPQNIGITQNYSEVRAPVVLTPNVPAFVAPGDQVQITSGVFSNLEKTGVVKVSLVPDAGWTMTNSEPQSFTLAPKAEATANFTLIAGEILGSHDLKFLAELENGRVIELTETISVRPASERRVLLQTALFTEKNKKLSLERSLFPEESEVVAGASYSPIVWIDGLRNYLSNYKYICTEQTISKAYPAIVLGKADDTQSIDALNKALGILQQRANSSGGFGMWSSTPDTDVFATLYAAEFMLDASERGFAVPQSMLNIVKPFIVKTARERSRGDLNTDARLQAQAIYLLNRQGVVTSNELSSLREELERYLEDEEWQPTLTGAYMAASYKMMKQDAAANALIKKQKWSLDADKWYAKFYYDDPLTHDAILIELMARYFPDELRKLPQSVLQKMGKRLQEQRYNSLSSALLVRALMKYENFAGASGDISLAAIFEKDKEIPLLMQGNPPRVSVPLGANAIIAAKPQSGQPAFIMLSEGGYDRTPADKSIDEGIEIFHEYIDIDENVLTQVKVGDEFFVRILIRSSGEKSVNIAAVVDLLPGGVEIVYNQPNLNADDDEEQDDEEKMPVGEAAMSSWQPNFVDPRDDRLLLYGAIDTESPETFTYRVRAVNTGTFTAPPPFAEDMYEPSLYGQGMSGKLEILPADLALPEATQ